MREHIVVVFFCVCMESQSVACQREDMKILVFLVGTAQAASSPPEPAHALPRRPSRSRRRRQIPLISAAAEIQLGPS